MAIDRLPHSTEQMTFSSRPTATQADPVVGFEFVPLDWSVEAMQRALERARSFGWNDPRGAFAVMAETVFWICVVHDQLRTRYSPAYKAAIAEDRAANARLLHGLRHVRDRITHAVDQVAYIEATPLSASDFTAVWTWQPLPPWDDTHNPDRYDDYQAVLAGQNVVDTLLQADIFLAATASTAWRNYGK